MSDLTDAIEAAALALNQYDWRFRGVTATLGGYSGLTRGEEIAQVVLVAAAPLIEAAARADERAKVAEEIAKAIEDTKPSSAHFWDTADTATVYALNRAAAIARTCVVHMPGAVQEGAEPPDAYPSEGGADSGAQKPAQEGVG